MKKGQLHSLESKRRVLSAEHKKNLSISAKARGVGKWMKGRKLSSEHLKNRSLAQSGKYNGSWRGGDGVGYRALHSWVVQWLGKPNKCESCGKVGYGHCMHWANKSGEYKRDLSDWLRLCVACHKNYDLQKIK